MEQLYKPKNNTKIGLKIVLSILFIVCLFPMPYGYFQFIRFLGMAGFAWLANIDSDNDDKTLMIVWIASAVLINPFIKVALGRAVWNIVDVIWAVILIVTIWQDVKVDREI